MSDKFYILKFRGSEHERESLAEIKRTAHLYLKNGCKKSDKCVLETWREQPFPKKLSSRKATLGILSRR